MGRRSRSGRQAAGAGWKRPVFASITPGLEAALADELEELGIDGQTEEGGVSFLADLRTLYAVHLWSRIAARVVARLGTIDAPNLDVLHTRAKDLPWKPHIHPGQPVDVQVSTQSARLRRKDAVQRKVENAITDAMRGPRLPGPRAPREPARVQVRIVGARATVSIDASGELLHKRGWRQETARAPLRENLAAAVLRLADWSPGTPLVDPMCGSGTFAIEAAGIALGHPPGARRDFAFQRWPIHDARTWEALVAEAAKMGPVEQDRAPIIAADRDEAAITATQGNARRARVERRIRVVRSPFQELEPPSGSGLVVINPPYGQRIGGSSPGRIYKGIGEVLKARWSGWKVAILLPGGRFKGALGFELEEKTTFRTGGIPVGLYVGTV